VKEAEDPSKKGQPRSFVLRRGRNAGLMKDLERDLRKLMAPNTATALKQHRKNVLKDFVHVAGPLGVTHFLLLSATNHASYLRIGGWFFVRRTLLLSLTRSVARSLARSLGRSVGRKVASGADGDVQDPRVLADAGRGA